MQSQQPQKEQRKDYPPDYARNEIRIENLEKGQEHLNCVADQFLELQTSLKVILWVARVIGALAVLLFGDVLKKKMGL